MHERPDRTAQPLRGRGLRVGRRQRRRRQRDLRAGAERLRVLPDAVRRMSRGLGIFALAVGGLVVAAAAALGFKGAPEPVPTAPPRGESLAADARKTLKAQPKKPAQDSLTRAAERMTLRVRNISCAGVATGSGFAVDQHTIITNRHVLEGAAVLELNTWDGASIDADVD